MPAANPEGQVGAVEATVATSSASAAARGAPVGISGGYQPALDGIRAIAVSLVIVFHLGLAGFGQPLSGGWLGVDVFFVLSGYLITSLLLSERRRNGRTNLRNFYVRRLLRLAPLSILLVLVCWIGERTPLGPPLDLTLMTRGAVSILFYFSNWMYLQHKGSTGSLMHAWSLSIEEQFYLVWPTVVVAAFALAKRNARWLLLALAAGAAVACGLYRRHLWYQATATGSGDQIWYTWQQFYFGSFQRPDGLVIGCVLALLLHGRNPTRLLQIVIDSLALVAAVVAALIVAYSAAKLWMPWAPFLPAWGLSTLNVSIAVVLGALVMHPTSLGARALSLRPICWVGRRAYGIYLIHPLVVAVVLHQSDLPNLWSATLAVVTTLVLAGLSFRWVETPFLRFKDRFSSHVTPAPTSEPAT